MSDVEPGRAPTVADLRMLIPAMAAWAVGAAALGLSPRMNASAAAVLALVAVLLVRRRSGGRSRPVPVSAHPPGASLAPLLALVFAAMSVVLTAAAAQSAVHETGPVRALAAEHAAVEITGRVTSDPMLVGGARLGGATVRLTVDVHQVSGRGRETLVSTPVLVIGDESWQAVRWHETIRARGTLMVADPGEAVVAVFRPLDRPSPVAPPGLVPRVADHLRAGLRRAADPLPADARGLIPALVIGDTSRTPADLTEAMLATGMTHLSAVSGSNVAIVLTFALGAAGLVGIPRQWRPVVAVAALAAFVVLARPEPSVVRAATMGVIGLIGLSRSRRGAGIPVLSAAVIVLLVVDPWLSRSYGFALSTLATLGLLLFTRSWGDAIGRRLPTRIRSWGPAIAIPVAAQAMCAPVVVLLQGSVSVVGVFANLLAAPLVAPATVCGVAAAVVAPLWPFGATMLCWLGALPTLGIAWVARTCATIPGGTLPWPDGAPGALLLTALTVAVVVTGRWWAHRAALHPVLAVAGAILLVACLAPTTALTWPPAGWRFVACDVGQGDGLVLATTPGHAVLVDAGPDPAAINTCLGRLHITVLDSVVLSHFHADHVDGLPGAFAGRDVREISGGRSRGGPAPAAYPSTTCMPGTTSRGTASLRRCGGRRAASPRGRCPTTPASCWPSGPGASTCCCSATWSARLPTPCCWNCDAARRWLPRRGRSTCSRRPTTGQPTSMRPSWKPCGAQWP